MLLLLLLILLLLLPLRQLLLLLLHQVYVCAGNSMAATMLQSTIAVTITSACHND
jgi:hypothetical protein